jgi:hypothetical protein
VWKRYTGANPRRRSEQRMFNSDHSVVGEVALVGRGREALLVEVAYRLFTITNGTWARSALPSGRVWFAMKPDRVWTKQHDGFLHFDPALKARPGHGQGLKVKIPGNQSQVVRAHSGTQSATPQPMRKQSIASSFGSEDGEKTFVVRIPRSAFYIRSYSASVCCRGIRDHS